MKAEWRQVTMRKAIEHAKQREIDTSKPQPYSPCNAVEWFTDGTAIKCESRWSGPISDVTPDIDADPPQWYIYS